MVVVVDCWGDNPPTEKALRHRLDTLKKLAAKYDSGSTNPSGVSSSGVGGKGKSIKKEEGGGYVTPMSSPKAVSRSPSKSPHGRGKKRVKVESTEEDEEEGDSGTSSDVEVSAPRRTRRKVSLVKYVELGDGGSDHESGDMYEDDSEEDEWKPKAVDDGQTEIVRAAGRSAVGHGGKSQVRGQGRVPGTKELEVGDSDEEEEEEEEGRVRDEIRVASHVLRENMSKGNFEVFA